MRKSASASTAREVAGPTLRATELAVHIRFVPKSKAKGLAAAAALLRRGPRQPEPEPTDICVYNGKPWHYAGLPGHTKELQAHPKVHKEYRNTVLVVIRKKRQSVVWWSETAFSDVTIAPSKHPNRFYPEADTTAPRN